MAEEAGGAGNGGGGGLALGMLRGGPFSLSDAADGDAARIVHDAFAQISLREPSQVRGQETHEAQYGQLPSVGRMLSLATPARKGTH
jgi:hypothetical protein